MRKGAAGSRACDPKFRIGVTSTFADVAYFKNAVDCGRWRFSIYCC